METPLVLRAAWRALGGASESAIYHSDRGSQSASEMFRTFLGRHGVEQSMSRKANCYDNAAGAHKMGSESFWATLKTECFDNFRNGIPVTRQEARQKIFRYIELFYNPKRLHSALDYLSPADFEQNYFNKKEINLSLCVSS